jgi:hypothetical protein
MTVLDQVDLRDAQTSVAIANTPIFLARRLHENPATLRAHANHGPMNIFGALESIANRKPEGLRHVTEVYFYLVALSFDNDLSWVRKAAALSAPHVKWFSEVAEYLVVTAKSTVTMSLHASSQAVVPQSQLVIEPPPPRNSTANTSNLIRL